MRHKPSSAEARGRRAPSQPIEDYALLGDCETAALVSRAGSIDWLCWPRFDSGACFAALLGTPGHGRWLMAPVRTARQVTRRYRTDTLILETDFVTSHGAVTVIDFMPLREAASHLVRLVVGRRGRVLMRTELILRFDYGSLVPWAQRLRDGTHTFTGGAARVTLRTPARLHGESLTTVGEFGVAAGQTVPFVLSYAPSHRPLPAPLDARAALARTERFWRRWLGPPAAGEYDAAVRRSLVTLKALTHRPSGGILAAATTSLPERLGGRRNWDYRYCWVRDATFTLQAMMNAGHYEEAEAWRAWLLRAAAGDPAQLQTMYGPGGERLLPEWELSWLPGYAGSYPVRIGNAASQQQQLDVYGEIMDCLHQARRERLAANDAGWALQTALLAHVEEIWREPDQGMWEVRGAARHFTYSKVMAWVAVDRAICSARRYHLPAPLRRWERLRARIHRDVCRHGFNARVGAFTRAYGSRQLDASVLLLPLVGFLPPEDPRVRSTVAAIEKHLMPDGLVRRYDTAAARDGLPAGEGVFLACSFWLADNLVLLGRRRDARRLFERLLSLRNDVGLLAEEYDPRTERLLGNFPQSFSHVAIINTAHNLTRQHGPARQRAFTDRPAPRRRRAS